jgi:hypothetical protein
MAWTSSLNAFYRQIKAEYALVEEEGRPAGGRSLLSCGSSYVVKHSGRIDWESRGFPSLTWLLL